jgi:KaiC/GvpD/RAD55 family RecA-like ATPase
MSGDLREDTAAGEERPAGTATGTPSVSPFIDWHEAFNEDRPDVEWIGQGALARGRGHSIWAKGGSGKSEFMQWVSLEGLRAGHVVLYLDYEMVRDDVVDRMIDSGCKPDDLDRLKYALIPDLAPLDTPAGAADLGALVDGVQGQHPDRHLVVIIDTIGRAVEGAENDNDTILPSTASAGTC